MDKLSKKTIYLKKINFVTLLIGFVGFCISLYALIVHLQISLKNETVPMCDFNSVMNCSSVIGSSYGEFAAIPLGAYGMSYFAIVLVAALMPKVTKVDLKWLAFWEFIISLVGLVFIFILAYISYFILHIVCPTCSIIHVLVLLYFMTKIKQFIPTLKEQRELKNDVFMKFFALCLCFAIPPLAAGLLAPFIVNQYFSATEKMIVPTTPLGKKNEVMRPKTEFMMFNKTNFVGNGEDYRRGNDAAKVIVQVFSDFGCPHCRIATEALLKAQDHVGKERVLFVYRFFPLSNICNPYVPSEGVYPYACVLAEASRCAGQQGKFWEFKSWGFSGQLWNNATREQNFSLNGLSAHAAVLGIKTKAFTQCLENHMELQKIKDDAAFANKLNIQGTPLILINGVVYEGAHTPEAFVQAFLENLKRFEISSLNSSFDGKSGDH
jgi:protein-disulfide isomerase/uncharacterized membrane protein